MDGALCGSAVVAYYRPLCSKIFGELKMIVRTPNEFRRDAIFLPVSFEEFWNSELHQDHVKPRRVD
jgi:hypothetical protein